MNFLNKFNNTKNIRFEMFKKVFEIACERNLKTLVETGTSRGKIKFFFFRKYNWKDGMSTIMLSHFAKFIKGRLYTCDILSKNIEAAKKFTKNYSDFISYHHQDSVLFLKKFDNPIDLLYLDSYDGHDPIAASKHQLLEAQTSIKNIHQNSLILLDDKGSKTNLSINFYLKNNFKIIFETKYQILLSQNDI
tara:strand:- start:285 stop:857 length:573 start_codon:yes stop_codon:yes gene_type:complete